MALRKRAKGGVDVISAATSEENSQDWLGRSLKQLFDNIAGEPIPQRIMDKLQELEQKD